MAGDWGHMSLPELEKESPREFEGLEQERDRLRRAAQMLPIPAQSAD